MTVGPDDRSSEPAVPSPCVSVCKMAADRSHCLGCLRTLAEIKAWRTMAPEEQRTLLAALERRRAGAGGITRCA